MLRGEMGPPDAMGPMPLRCVSWVPTAVAFPARMQEFMFAKAQDKLVVVWKNPPNILAAVATNGFNGAAKMHAKTGGQGMSPEVETVVEQLYQRLV